MSNVTTAINYAIAGGVGVGAASVAGKFAPDALKPDGDGEHKALLVAGGIGGGVGAMQILPRVGKNQLQKALVNEAAFKADVFLKVADHNLPTAQVLATADQLRANNQAVAGALATATASGTNSGLASKVKFGAAAAAGAIAAVGILAGGVWAYNNLTD